MTETLYPKRMDKPCIKCGKIERNYRGNCKPCKREWQKQWINKNSEVKKQRDKKYYDANKDRIKAKSLEWHRKNKDKAKQAFHRWREKNPERYRDIRSRAHHMRRNAPGKLSKGIIQVLLQKQDGKCACCGIELNGRFHVDHIMPIALGGANTDDNVQLMTPECNRLKGYMHPDDYAKLRLGYMGMG